jgi:mono/diheme cytochrome c family protein
VSLATPYMALGVALALSASAASADDAPTGDVGEHVYTTICQGCHMPNAQGAVGAGFYPKLAGDPALVSWQYVAVTVLNGRHGMPSFGSTQSVTVHDSRMDAYLSDEEIAAVVNYVRTHFGNKYKDKATVKGVSELPHPGEKGSGHAG